MIDKIKELFSDDNLDRLKLIQAIEQSPETVVITDLEGKIEYVNPMFTKLNGYSREEVVGKNPQILKSGYPGGCRGRNCRRKALFYCDYCTLQRS